MNRKNPIQYFPIYQDGTQIYRQDGSITLPLALVRKVGETPKARLLRNRWTQQEAWFPNSAFLFHWHVFSLTEDCQLCLLLPPQWIKKKQAFFFQKRLL